MLWMLLCRFCVSEHLVLFFLHYFFFMSTQCFGLLPGTQFFFSQYIYSEKNGLDSMLFFSRAPGAF